MLQYKEIELANKNTNELDTSYEKKIFDIQYEIDKYTFFFRCTQIIENNNIKNDIVFLKEDSDKCDKKSLNYMLNRITEIYL